MYELREMIILSVMTTFYFTTRMVVFPVDVVLKHLLLYFVASLAYSIIDNPKKVLATIWLLISLDTIGQLLPLIPFLINIFESFIATLTYVSKLTSSFPILAEVIVILSFAQLVFSYGLNIYLAKRTCDKAGIGRRLGLLKPRRT